MAAKVYCRTTGKDTQSYYLEYGNKTYYLFGTRFYRSNREFFVCGRYIQEVLDARRHESASVRRASVRLIGAIKYIENEYGICVLRQTAKKRRRNACAAI